VAALKPASAPSERGRSGFGLALLAETARNHARSASDGFSGGAPRARPE